MENNQYPRILLIGNVINLHWGGGITLYNLIKGWPADKIAVAAPMVYKDGLEICTNYYKFGYEELKRIWPLNKFQPYYESGELDFSQSNKSFDQDKYITKLPKYNKRFKRLIEKSLYYLGIHHILFPSIKVSSSFLSWFDKFNPDIVYSQLPEEYIFFVTHLLKKRKRPLVIHIMDDWINSFHKPGLSRLTWNGRITRKFGAIIKGAEGLMSICDAMSEEYKNRYNRDFMPFHNCIEFEKWEKYRRTNHQISDKFVILYAGRIGPGTSTSIISIAKAVEIIGNRNINIEFQIQTKEISAGFDLEIQKLKYTRKNNLIPYEQLPEKFASADLLVLPMDFDKDNLNFIHLSMPTKVPEYMISGTPILVYADKSTALNKYASKEDWAFVVSDDNIDNLSEKIFQIYNSMEDRIRISQNAYKVVMKNHICQNNRIKFKDFLANVATEKNNEK
jgi:glycosyltransferase involved in cell wall biosynthesis